MCKQSKTRFACGHPTEGDVIVCRKITKASFLRKLTFKRYCTPVETISVLNPNNCPNCTQVRILLMNEEQERRRSQRPAPPKCSPSPSPAHGLAGRFDDRDKTNSTRVAPPHPRDAGYRYEMVADPEWQAVKRSPDEHPCIAMARSVAEIRVQWRKERERENMLPPGFLLPVRSQRAGAEPDLSQRRARCVKENIEPPRQRTQEKRRRDSRQCPSMLARDEDTSRAARRTSHIPRSPGPAPRGPLPPTPQRRGAVRRAEPPSSLRPHIERDRTQTVRPQDTEGRLPHRRGVSPTRPGNQASSQSREPASRHSHRLSRQAAQVGHAPAPIAEHEFHPDSFRMRCGSAGPFAEQAPSAREPSRRRPVAAALAPVPASTTPAEWPLRRRDPLPDHSAPRRLTRKPTPHPSKANPRTQPPVEQAGLAVGGHAASGSRGRTDSGCASEPARNLNRYNPRPPPPRQWTSHREKTCVSAPGPSSGPVTKGPTTTEERPRIGRFREEFSHTGPGPALDLENRTTAPSGSRSGGSSALREPLRPPPPPRKLTKEPPTIRGGNAAQKEPAAGRSSGSRRSASQRRRLEKKRPAPLELQPGGLLASKPVLGGGGSGGSRGRSSGRPDSAPAETRRPRSALATATAFGKSVLRAVRPASPVESDLSFACAGARVVERGPRTTM